MVVRAEGRLCLLEATGDGVVLYRLDKRLNFYRKTAKLGIRRLGLPRDNNMLRQLSKFVDKHVGKPYRPLLDVVM